MHEAPHRTSRSPALRRMARTARITVPALTVCLAAGLAAAVATGARGTTNPGLPQNEQPGGGAVLVGGGVAMLVGMLLRIAYVLHERRRNPDKKYSIRTKAGGTQYGLTAQQYLRLLAPTCCSRPGCAASACGSGFSSASPPTEN
jgi:hypothetical protein